MLRDRLNTELKEAMKAREEATVSTLRMVNAAIKDKDIAARPSGNADGIDDPAILSLLQTMVKQRRESVAMYSQGGRADLVAKEEAEITVIERYLPAQMDAAAMEKAVDAAIAEAGAGSIKDMGKVMGGAEGEIRRADGFWRGGGSGEGEAGWVTGVRCQMSDVRCQMSDVLSQIPNLVTPALSRGPVCRQDGLYILSTGVAEDWAPGQARGDDYKEID